MLSIVQSVMSIRRARSACWLFVGAACLLATFVGDAAAEGKNKSSKSTSWYVSAVVSGRSGYRITNYWSKGSKLRAETMSGVHPIVTIVRGDRYWVYDELLKKGIEIKRSAPAVAEDATRIRPFGNDLEDLIRSNGEKVESVVLGEVAAEIWRATNQSGRRTVWVTVSEPRVPLRVENFDRESGESATLNYSNWASGFDLPDSAFEPPADLDLEKFEYDDYVAKSLDGLIGPAPVLYPHLLHGSRPR